MEEKKPEMKIASKEGAEKMSYEQLENTAHQLSEQSRNLYMQNQKLVQKLQEANLSNFFKRLEWLWAIINSTTSYITEEFKTKCGEEFMYNMTLAPESEGESKEEPEKK